MEDKLLPQVLTVIAIFAVFYLLIIASCVIIK